MPLSIRNPEVEKLARQLARERQTSMTDVLLTSLQNEARRTKDNRPLSEKIKGLADELKSLSKPGGHMMTKDEIDKMWGHE